MKKPILQWSLAIITLIMAASCSTNGDSRIMALLDRVPKDAEIVAVGNLRTIIESTGGSIDETGITLPEYIMAQIPSSTAEDLAKANEFLANSGIDTETMALSGFITNARGTLIFAIADHAKFRSTLDREGFGETGNENGVKYFSDREDKMTVAIDDDFGYLFMSHNSENTAEAVRSLGRFISDAATSPFSQTPFASYISESNAIGLTFRIPNELQHELRRNDIPPAILHFYDGVFCIQCDINDNTITSRMKWFNADGTERNFSDLYVAIDFSAKINADALAYLGGNESLVGAVSLKNMDWDTYIETMSQAAGLPRSERAMLSVIKGYLENIDGTVAFGLGLDNGLESVFNLSKGHEIMNQFSVTMVVETKPLEAGKLLDNIKTFMDLGSLKYENTQNGLIFNIPETAGAIYAEATENMLIISNKPISNRNNNVTVRSFPFTDYLAAGGLVLNRENALMHDLSIDYDIIVSATSASTTFESTTKIIINGGGQEGVIAKIIKIAVDIARQSDSLESRRHESDEYAAEEVIEN